MVAGKTHLAGQGKIKVAISSLAYEEVKKFFRCPDRPFSSLEYVSPI